MSAWTRAISSALVDFIWQGAVVGLILWVILLLLRRRSPSTRYLVSCASLLTLSALPIVTMLALAGSVTAFDVTPSSSPADSPAASNMPQTMLPIALLSGQPRIFWLEMVQQWALPVWSIGVMIFSVRLAWGFARSLALRRTRPCADGAVLDTVRTLATRIGIGRPIRVVGSSLSDGPSVVGWLRPTLLLPPAAAMGLTSQQLEAVLAHELAHIKRHDYLVNLAQLVLETLFFYHPVVWWISNQIRAERELCCDDVAVRACGDPVVYARALTTLARHQLTAAALAIPAAGASLLHRVRRLVGVNQHEYGPSQVPSMVAAGLVVACVVLNLDWLQASAGPQAAEGMRFEVVSVKRNVRGDGLIFGSYRAGRFRATGYTVADLIRSAYQVQEFQIVGRPAWIDSDKFDIEATASESAPALEARAVGQPTEQQLMLRTLLAERFGLVVHKETRQMPVFALVLARNDRTIGPQLRPSTMDCSPGAERGRTAEPEGGEASPWESVKCGTSVGPGVILGGGRTMAEIAEAFSRLTNTGSSLNRLVVDRTGLEGRYDLELHFTPENIPNVGSGGLPPGLPPIDPTGPSIFTAVREQLGLKLDSQRGPVDVLVIDRVEQPTEN